MTVTVHHVGTRYECVLCDTGFLYETRTHNGKKLWTIRHCLALNCPHSDKVFLLPEPQVVELEEFKP